MRNKPAPHRSLAVLLGACAGLFVSAGATAQVEGGQNKSESGGAVLRVCADPDNLPQSNQQGEGFENKIAEQLARDLGRRLEYTYFPQRMGFVRNTLRQKDPVTHQFKCDVIIGVPKGYELTATTRPYMRSTYALVFRPRPELEGLATAGDLLKLPPEKLRTLRIGVFAQSPGADWLLRNDLLDRAAFYAAQSGDPHENPALIIERDLDAGNIDLAIVWGPVAGFLVRSHSASPAWRAVPFAHDPQIKFDYEISMGVRQGEKEWKETLDGWIAAHEQQVREILTGFHVPLLDATGNVIGAFRSDERVRASGVPKQIPLQLHAQSKDF
jgi:quinoprotein dehydrogenase-associated probable ABC transporter substrate-binding protein